MAAAGITVALAMGAVGVPLAQADDLKDRQDKVEERIEGADHALEDSSARYRRAFGALQAAQARLTEAKSALDTARTRLGDARVRDQEMQEALEVAQARLEQAQADLDQGQDDLESQRDAVTDMITSIYQEGDPQLQAFSSMLQAQSQADLTWTQEGQSVMVGHETHAYDELRAAEVLLTVRQEQMADAEADVAEKRKAAADHLVLMRDLTEQARAARATVREVVIERRDAKAAASQARARDLAALHRLKEREQQIKERIARAAAQASSGGFNGRTDGFLSYPTTSPVITSPYGYRVHPIYGYYSLHNGTDFRAYCGTPLLAAAGGKVIAKYYDSVYGNRLYVSVGIVNGKPLTLVYNHATSYTVDIGDTVGRGQTLGYSGSTGWSTACHLHFITMSGGTPVNPMNFM